MAFETKAKIAGLIFLGLLLFTEPGREVTMEVLGTAIVLLVCGFITLLGFFAYEEIKQKIGKKNQTTRNEYKD